MRQQGVQTPILMLTARGQVVDRVVGLKLGADDYLTKPFGNRELIARVRALLRRHERLQELLAADRAEDATALRLGPLELDPTAHEARLADEETGANMLHLVFGFLEWQESASSDKSLLAPLVCVPV